jgi:hypothetical protein
MNDPFFSFKVSPMTFSVTFIVKRCLSDSFTHQNSKNDDTTEEETTLSGDIESF